MKHKVLFRAAGNTGFENVSPSNRSDWVKETHCVVKAKWKFIFLWFYIFFIFPFYYTYVLNSVLVFRNAK